LDYHHAKEQLLLIDQRFSSLNLSLIAGDFNAHLSMVRRNDFENVFTDSTLRTCFFDSVWNMESTFVDHILYDPRCLRLVNAQVACLDKDQALEQVLDRFGSDHLFLTAQFSF
jgi:endonuclease/exonuclease/phosphatase (EEP) superfamily protein YafD